MAGNTKIEWATHTFNPWLGCTNVSPACDNCYAEDMMDKRYGRVKWGAGQPRVRTAPGTWLQPIRWNRDAELAGRTDITVFCLSLGDIWDNEVPQQWRQDLFALIRKTPHLTWLLLSKRIGNAINMVDGRLPGNCALGATMANQQEWDRDASKLAKAGKVLGAKFTFASVEPMLGPISTWLNTPNWIIVGGESGAHAREMNPDWARSVREQCRTNGARFFFKQMTRKAPIPDDLLIRERPF